MRRLGVVSGSRFAVPLPEDSQRTCGTEEGVTSRVLGPVDPQETPGDEDSATG